MSYTPKTWENRPSTASPINANNLNHMEGGIKTNDDNIVDAQNAILTLQGEMLQAQGDISALETLVDSMLPGDTESGNPTVITDAFGGACKSLKLTLEPIQSGSGTPSPDNVRPISGRTQVEITRTGKNLFGQPYSSSAGTSGGIKATINADGSVNFDGTPLTQYYFSYKVGTNNIFLKAGTYTISNKGDAIPSHCSVHFMVGGQSNYINGSNPSRTFTLTTDGTFTAYMYINTPAGNVNFTPKIQLEVGSIATDYEPYNGTDYTIQLGQTVYGGVLDVTSGVLTIDYVLQNYVWGVGSAASTDLGSNTRRIWYLGYVPDLAKPMYCDVAPYLANYTSDTIHFYLGASTAIIFLPTNTASDFSFNIACALATPTTVQLTAEEVTLLHGDNVLTTDADSIEASYSADIALYIEKKISEGANNRSLAKGGASEEEPKKDVKEEEEIEEPKKEETR